MAKKRTNFLVHLHPPVIRERTLQPLATLGLGIVCLTCFIVLAATGLTLFLYYIPHHDVAYERVLHIITTLRYGRLIRNVHFLAANVLLIAGILHLARVFFTGSYQGRFVNWVYGLLLLSLILASNFTGYLLPWDQTSYWAIKVGSSLATYFPVIGPSIKRFLVGGEDIGHDTLIRSFTLHVAVLPALWVVLTSLHLWRIRKDGGLAAPDEPESARINSHGLASGNLSSEHSEREGEAPAALPLEGATRAPLIASSPALFRAELAAGLLTLSLIIALSFFIDTPLSGRADPLRPPNPAKAPWYFVGIQELVSHSATLGGVIVPVLIGLFLLLCPVLDRSKQPGGRWFAKGRLAVNVIFALILLSQVVLIAVGQWFRSKNWDFTFPW